MFKSASLNLVALRSGIQDDVAKHPELTRDYLEYLLGKSDLAKKNSMETWKPIEIDRLRLEVMEERLKRTPTQ
jgi:hypothetical protein